MKKYLPSKQFTYSLIVIVVIGAIIFGISNYFSKKSHYLSKKNTGLDVSNMTLDNLLQKDSDGDGVMDWEEALWNTDPMNPTTFDGVKDAEYIKKRKAELNIKETPDGVNGGTDLTETDKFAQEFFASVVAMKQSGQVDQSTINNVSAALGQRISDPTIVDQYSEKDARLSAADNKTTRKKYYSELKTLFEASKKSGLGDELNMVSSVANTVNNDLDPAVAERLNTIAISYQDFAQKMLDIPVPKSLTTYQVEIANSANNTGIAIQNMAKISSDPIVGLSGLSQYKKYSNDLISSVNKLQAAL